jgi:ubiquinone/menaquinone biosynthesis C-methylase UbiE
MHTNTLKIINKDHFRQNLNIYTRNAFFKLPKIDNPKILDVGCGTGVPTLELARVSGGEILATDIDQDALDYLDEKIKSEKLEKQVKTLNCSLLDLDFPDESFDIIWAEGSIFAIGFQKGLEDLRRLIKDNGFLVVHDPYQKHMEKKDIIEKSGYRLLDSFMVHHRIWWSQFLRPYEKHIKDLQGKYIDNPQVHQALKDEENEIKMFKKDPESFSSIFYVMKKKK